MSIEVGTNVKAIGIGEIFVGVVEGATGRGEIVHYSDPTKGIRVTADEDTFPEQKTMFSLFPEQTEEGAFYRDSGTKEVLWLALEDVEVI
jgi:hypothetical protein